MAEQSQSFRDFIAWRKLILAPTFTTPTPLRFEQASKRFLAYSKDPLNSIDRHSN
jgi:hypothetical protein